jgi:hypothetical protein
MSVDHAAVCIVSEYRDNLKAGFTSFTKPHTDQGESALRDAGPF